MRRFLSMLLLLLVLAGCAEQHSGLTVKPTRRPPIAFPQLPETEAACQAAGGDWRRRGLAGFESCDLPASDAGMPCSDSSECQGLCLSHDPEPPWPDPTPETYSVGYCSERVINFSCQVEVRDGKVEEICHD